MATLKPTVFISYRRADHPDFVERIRDWFIANGYDDERVFMDLSNMPYFTDFAEFIREKVLESEVVIVIIGPQWLDLLRERAARDETDYVRLEIAIALEQGKLVAPICIKGAKMLNTKDLQDFPDLSQMTRYHAPELDSGRPFLKNIADIIGALEAELERRNNKKVTPPPKIEVVESPPTAKPKFTTEQQKLLDLIVDPKTKPPERAEAGRRLAEIGDPRPGVGLRPDGIPDIDWVEIPAGEFIFGGDRSANKSLPRQILRLPKFFISRYPVTSEQYLQFLSDGYGNLEWWQYSSEAISWRRTNSNPPPALWRFTNYPCVDITWYEAVAFCRWLTAKVGYEITLPTEQEWEKAARGDDGRNFPWGNEYIQGYANVNENRIQHYDWHTMAVGMYPFAKSPYGVLDMSGNIWEWCLNEFDDPENTKLIGIAPRVVRGGTWYYGPDASRTTSRFYFDPNDLSYGRGFRIVCR